jgi:hypothetical protein
MTVWLNRFSMCNALAMVDECQDYLVKFGIIMSEIGKMSTQQWKTLSNKNIAILNRESLLEIMKTSYKKLDANELKLETFKLKPYMTKMHLTQARLNFRIRSFMTRTVKMNFSSDPGFKNQLWTCSHCPSVDTQSHIRLCPAYEKFRIDKDFNNDHDLVCYFQQVIALREADPTRIFKMYKMWNSENPAEACSRVQLMEIISHYK